MPTRPWVSCPRWASPPACSWSTASPRQPWPSAGRSTSTSSSTTSSASPIPDSLSQAPEQGGILNLPAVILILLCTLLLIRGASESAKTNAVMVMIKIGVLVMFIVLGLQGWNSDNLSDFAPFGFNGITAAAGIIFFSYIGLDAVSTAGEEVKNPRRTMPLAILIALVDGHLALHPGHDRRRRRPAVRATSRARRPGSPRSSRTSPARRWPGTVLAAGAVISIFSVTLVVIYGQTRILFAMARDGMMPEIFHKVNPRTLTPVPQHDHRRRASSRCLPGLIPINFLAEMTSIGTLVAFLVVSIGVIVLRYTHPELPRGFKVPFGPVIPLLSIAGCIWIIQDLRAVTIWVFLIWVAAALRVVLLLRLQALAPRSPRARRPDPRRLGKPP